MSSMGNNKKCASNELGWDRNIKVTIVVNDLQRVSELRQRMPRDVGSSFEKDYGPILDLLLIQVQESVLSALAQFWKTNLRCFQFPNLDMVPTIEEYETMIGRPYKQTPEPYLYRGSHVKMEKIASLIGLKPELWVSETRGSLQGWKKSVFKDHLKALAKQGDWGHFKKTLALLIFGLVLFPCSKNLIDQAAMDVFHVVEYQKKNFVPAILAETLLTLKVCHDRKGGKLRCCSHMLYVWIITHLFAKGHMGQAPRPLRDFSCIPVQNRKAEDWKEIFASLEENDIRWVCPWYENRATIFSCGVYPNVPLMGPMGVIAYSPAIAVRQLKWTQDRPRDEELGGKVFQYVIDDDSNEREKIKATRRSIKKRDKKELGEPRVTTTKRYKEWRTSRILPQAVPKEVPPEEESSLSKDNLISLLAVTKAQLALMEDREVEAKAKIQTLEHHCKRKDEDLDRLKDDMADQRDEMTDQNLSKKRKRALSESQALQSKLEASEEMLAMIREENRLLEEKLQEREQWVEVLKEELTNKSQMAEDLYVEARSLEGRLERNENLLAEKEESLNFWRTKAEHEKDLKQASRRECDNMDAYVHRHGANMVKLLDPAIDAMNANPGAIPLNVRKFIRYCDRLADHLGVQRMQQ